MNMAPMVVSQIYLGITCQELGMGKMSCQQSPNSFIAYFGVASLASYASAPNHLLGQWLGCPAPVLATLRSALSARVVKGELLRLCFRFIWSSTSVEKAENRLSWCCESWSTTRWLIGIFRDSLRIIRRTFFLQVIYVTHHIGISRTHARGYIIVPPIKLLWLSESVSAL